MKTTEQDILVNDMVRDQSRIVFRNFLAEKTTEQLLKMKANDERNIGLAKGEIAGPECGKFSWMLPAWEKGLEILNEVIHEREMQNK